MLQPRRRHPVPRHRCPAHPPVRLQRLHLGQALGQGLAHPLLGGDVEGRDGERADAAGVEAAGKALELRLLGCARDIHDKYVCPPHTTDFGLLYLPTEGLYAEVVRRPGLEGRAALLFSPVFGQVSAQALTEWLLASGLRARLSLQLHKLVWGPEVRGV